jgi:hypothetical protein
MKISQPIAGLCLATLLSACGGGGDSPASTPAPGPSAEGVYGGTLTGATSTAFQMLVLENSDFWSMYGINSTAGFMVAGLVQGSGTSSNGSFTSSNAKDFGVSPAVAGTLAASYDATAKTISGNIKSGTNTVTFNGGPVAGSLYNYNIAASLTNIAGQWSLSSTSGETVGINISASGTYTALSRSGCSFAGTIAPRASGKNVFNISMTFGGAPCGLAGQSGSGIALSYPLANGQTQLIVASTDSTRTYGSVAFGNR